MSMIKGIEVILHGRTKVGVDDFNHPVYSEVAMKVENVLVYPSSTTEILDTLNLTGKKAVYNLAVPKGDTHEWSGNVVEFFGKKWRVINLPQEGIEELIPLEWNQKWQVERYG